ncbi:MAG TPA: hybrid sensor histidine kinase/response regulator [Chloroflexi bacterium]|nr:hybrid sensor histidine kinase/response regulator [Chloroflexota bacterium]
MQSNTVTTVLIVEDDVHLNLALVETLQTYGYATLSAYHGREAIDLLRQQLPDVIVCDINMPVMDGYTFLQHTRAEPAWRLLPFIFLTAHTTTENQRRAKAIGIEDYLSKPIDARDLVAAIENALKRRRLIAAEIERSLDNLRNRIVGLLQHEFRTPLTFILGYAELLLNSGVDNLDAGQMRAMASAILDGGQRLQQQIETFLFMAELQSHKLDPKAVEPVNAWSLWNDILRDFANTERLGPLPVQLLGQNDTVIVKVDVHLVDAAVRHLFDFMQRVRRPDATRIECSIIHQFPYVGLAIQCDSAAPPPLPPSRQEGADNPITPTTVMDMDLGLTLAQSVAHLHGGKLTIESEESGGLQLVLWLPGVESI